MGQRQSQIFRSEPGPLSDACKHPRPDLVAIVEGPDEVGEAFALEHLVRSLGLALDRPADALECREHARRLGGAPAAHAAAEAVSKVTLTGPRVPSSWSSRSASHLRFELADFQLERVACLRLRASRRCSDCRGTPRNFP